MWLTLVLHYLCNVSRDRSTFVLRIIHILLSMTNLSQDVINGIPTDIRTAEAGFGLQPCLTKFMSCPACRKLYHPNDINFDKGSPEFCTYKEVSRGPECNTPLWKVERMQGTPRFVPRLTFIYQNLPNWLARFLARPGIEVLLRHPLPSVRGEPPSIIRDIWDGNAVRTFKDTNGNPFFEYHGEELRLLFGFGYDGFNPFHNKAGRKKASVGAIFLVCYNLPSYLRLLPENIYLVGVVPGYKQPSLTRLNHYLEPLVEELQEFFDSGFYFSSTPDSPNGVVAKGAAFPGIMDIHAARQVFGLGSFHTQWFCTHCLLRHDDIDQIQPNQWPRWHTNQRHQGLMEIWKNQATENAQKAIFQQINMRWTVLSRLSYFDMKIMCIFDPMHTFLNLFRNLVENTWTMDVTEPSGDGLFVGSRPASMTSVTNREIYKTLILIRKTITSGNIELMDDAQRAQLWFLCERHGLRRAGERVQPYRRTVVQFYVSFFHWFIFLILLMILFRMDLRNPSKMIWMNFDTNEGKRLEIKKPSKISECG